MLEELTIKDFALIESDYLEFSDGLTVLSGETGAGKSIVICGCQVSVRLQSCRFLLSLIVEYLWAAL